MIPVGRASLGASGWGEAAGEGERQRRSWEPPALGPYLLWVPGSLSPLQPKPMLIHVRPRGCSGSPGMGEGVGFHSLHWEGVHYSHYFSKVVRFPNSGEILLFRSRLSGSIHKVSLETFFFHLHRSL